jgi:hypothetical protein
VRTLWSALKHPRTPVWQYLYSAGFVLTIDQVVGDRGAEVTYIYTDGDPKACFSFWSITADDSRFCLVLIAWKL